MKNLLAMLLTLVSVASFAQTTPGNYRPSNNLANQSADNVKITGGTINSIPVSKIMSADNNLSDLSDVAAARGYLGLKSMSAQDASNVAITGGAASFSALTTTGTTTVGGNIVPSTVGVFNLGSAGIPFANGFINGTTFTSLLRAYTGSTTLFIGPNTGNTGLFVYPSGRIYTGLTTADDGTNQLSVGGSAKIAGQLTLDNAGVGTLKLGSASIAASNSLIQIDKGINVNSSQGIQTVGNLSVDAGSGTNTFTLRDGTINKSSSSTSPFVFSHGINIAGNNIGTTGTNAGMKLQIPAFTALDQSTAANGTNSQSTNILFGAPTLTSTNTGVTTTTAYNVLVNGDPIAGTNQTIGNSYALGVLGKSYFSGLAAFANRQTIFGSINNAGSINFSRASDGQTVSAIGYSASNESSKFIINSFGGGGYISLGTGGVNDRLSILSNGRILVNTTTDDGTNQWQVNGGIYGSGNLTLAGSVMTLDAGSGTSTFKLRDGFITKTAGTGFQFTTGITTTGGTGIVSNSVFDLPASDASGNGQYRIGGTRVFGNYNNNLQIGSNAGNLTATGTPNIFLGLNSGIATTTAAGNTFLGHSTGYNTNTGGFNTLVGQEAMYYNTSGNNNVSIGYRSGWNTGLTGGAGNIFIGANSARNVTGTTYNNVIALGNDVLNGVGNLSNVFVTPLNVPHLVNQYTSNGTDMLQVTGGTSLNGALTVTNNITTSSNIIANLAIQGRHTLANSYSTGIIGVGGTDLNFGSHTITNTASASGDVVTHQVASGIAAPTLASTNPVTYTNASTLYIGGTPTAGSNVTIGTAWGLYSTGNTYFGGFTRIGGTADINLVRTSTFAGNNDITFTNVNSSIAYGRWFTGTTGNLILQNGGTFTDNNAKLQLTTATATSEALTVNGKQFGTYPILVNLTGNGSTTTFTVAHGLAFTPTMATYTANSDAADQSAFKYVSVDATNITIVYKTAPNGSVKATVELR